MCIDHDTNMSRTVRWHVGRRLFCETQTYLYRTVLETINYMFQDRARRKKYSFRPKILFYYEKNKVLVYIFFQISSRQIKELIVIFKSVRINFKNHAHKCVIF